MRPRGVAGGEERVSPKDTAQGVEGVDAVFPGRGDISADTAEVYEGVKAAEGAGDLLPQLHHFQIPFGQVVVERDREVAHDLGKPIGGQQRVVAQIDSRALDAGTLLHGATTSGGNVARLMQPQAQVLTSAWLPGDPKLRMGQIKDLPTLDTVRRLFCQGTSAARAALNRATHCNIRHGHHA